MLPSGRVLMEEEAGVGADLFLPLVSPPSSTNTGPPGLYALASIQYRWQNVPFTDESK